MENLQPEDMKLIRLYVLDLATEEEKRTIETRMKADEAFAQEVSVQRVAQMYQFTKIKDHLKELRDQMLADGELSEEKQELPLKDIPLLRAEKSSAEASPTETKIISLWPRRLAAAAVVLIMLGFGSWLWYRQQGPGQEMADKTKKPQTEHPAPISPDAEDMVNGLLGEARRPLANVPAPLLGAAEAFENQDTDEAIRLLQNKKTPSVGNKDDQQYGASQEAQEEQRDPVLESYRKFYLGVSYLSKGDAPKALVYLKQVKAPLEQEGRWYLALAYLKNNEPAKARPILTTVKEDAASRYAGEADLLLRELGK